MAALRISRREFLRRSAVSAAGVCLGPAVASAAEHSQSPATASVGMLVDTTRCIGCRACVRACSDRNHLPSEGTASLWEQPDQTLTYQRWTAVTQVRAGSREVVSVKRQCLHCLEPACVSVCPVGALRRLDSGAVVWRPERCIGCRYCVFACPFSAPKFQWDSGLTPVIGKCQLCAQQSSAAPYGWAPRTPAADPACAGACPTGALKFGRRDDLLREAQGRLQARPARYIQQIYGEHEAGGTAWLYMASVPFERLGFPTGLPRVGLPRLTWMALKLIPGIVTALAVVMSAVSAVLHRRTSAKASC